MANEQEDMVQSMATQVASLVSALTAKGYVTAQECGGIPPPTTPYSMEPWLAELAGQHHHLAGVTEEEAEPSYMDAAAMPVEPEGQEHGKSPNRDRSRSPAVTPTKGARLN